MPARYVGLSLDFEDGVAGPRIAVDTPRSFGLNMLKPII